MGRYRLWRPQGQRGLFLDVAGVPDTFSTMMPHGRAAAFHWQTLMGAILPLAIESLWAIGPGDARVLRKSSAPI